MVAKMAKITGKINMSLQDGSHYDANLGANHLSEGLSAR